MTPTELDIWMRASGFVYDERTKAWNKPKRAVKAVHQAPSAKPEPPPVRPCDDRPPREAIYPGRVHILITSHVCGQLRDEDNICPKFYIDCLRHSGLIRDDCPGVIELDVKEVRVSSKKEEGCEIVITPL